MFYMTFFNLTQKNNSRQANIHLIAICSSKHLKSEDGINRMLSVIIDEIKEMDKVGFKIFLPGKGNIEVFGTVYSIIVFSTNFGLNEAFVLVNSFNCDYCCSSCYATRDHMPSCFFESEFELRTPEKYQEDVRDLHTLQNGDKVRGVKNTAHGHPCLVFADPPS